MFRLHHKLQHYCDLLVSCVGNQAFFKSNTAHFDIDVRDLTNIKTAYLVLAISNPVIVNVRMQLWVLAPQWITIQRTPSFLKFFIGHRLRQRLQSNK